jgi:dynein heavy chain
LASYNTIGLKLKIYEQWFFRTWCEEIERAKAGLQATLIVRESDTGSLYVNFDIAIL